MNLSEPEKLALANGVLTIDVGAVVANYRTLVAQVAPARCAGVVKADSYGLGADKIAPALWQAGCRDFFVALIGEGLALRDILGPEARIYVLNGLPPGAENAAVSANLIPVLNSLAQCRAWKDTGRPAVLQVDSGMSRMGLSVADQEALLADEELLESLDLVLLMSHLANADEPDHEGNLSQHAGFLAASSLFPKLPLSLANSAGSFHGDSFHLDLCRPGAVLYGIEAGPRVVGIKPVVQLEARVGQLRDIPAGASIGYGYQFTADKPMRLATISVGYADGWPRSLSNRGAAWFSGQRLPIVGRVSMDSFVVDAGAVPELAEGDLVELIGEHQSADDVARDAGTIGYEILTNLGRRYHRIYNFSAGGAS